MEEMRISVIIPTYNRADLIGETIESVLKQSLAPFEIIVADDGSVDDTKSVVAQYGSAVKYLRIENSGECRARNVGVQASSGNWLAFCDSDDLWHPEKLALQAQLSHANPDVVYSFTNFKHVIDGHWSDSTKFDSLPEGFWDSPVRGSGADSVVVLHSLFPRLLKNQPIFPSTIMMTRDFFASSGGWDEVLGRTPSVDLEYHLRCANHGITGVVKAPVVGIRKHAANFSGDPLKTALGEIEILRYVLQHNPEAEKFRDEISEQIVLRSASAAHNALRLKNYALGEQLIKSVPLRRRSLKLCARSLMVRMLQSV